MISMPDGTSDMPVFDNGWLVGDGDPEPFLSFLEEDPSVNWSAALEQLHEESSRTHFIDRWTRSAIIERIGALPSKPSIADIGCSTGYLLEDLHHAHPDALLIGADLIAGGLRKAHRFVPSARLLQADACALPIDDAAVDAVVSANLLEHVPDDDRALREMARIVAPGGQGRDRRSSGPSHLRLLRPVPRPRAPLRARGTGDQV